jgi:hypothetical protein
MRDLIKITAATFLLLAACSTVPGPKFRPAPPPASAAALVYFYRPHSWKNDSLSPGIILDGRETFYLKDNGYAFFYLKPGLHGFALELSELYEGLGRVEFRTEPGRSYYVRVDTALGIGVGLKRSFTLVRVSEDDARDEIKDCEYVDPKDSALENH